VLARAPDVPAIAFRVWLKLNSWGAVILDRLITVPVETTEIRVDTSSHITSLVVQVFDESTGELVDKQGMRFNQKFDVGLVGHTGVDILPPPFRAPPTNVDLVERPRLSTSASSISGVQARIHPFGVLQRNANSIDVLAGRRAWRAETLFFSPGVDPQIEVIRWIKRRIESANGLASQY
jgi:hypothetical protein